MGVLKKLYCITSDPAGTAAYGLTFDVAYDASSPYAYEMILYKTNDYPASPITANLTWSVVSRIYHGAVIKDESGSDVLLRKFSCTVDALGVFTLFSRHWTSSKYDQNPKLPHVIRYDPNGTMENKGGYTGVGAWSMITVPTEHGWSSYFERAVSGYVSAPGGGSVLLVAYVTRDGETVGVASVDEQAKTLSPMSNWSMVGVNEGFVFLPNITVRVCVDWCTSHVFNGAELSISHSPVSNKMTIEQDNARIPEPDCDRQ